jgi:allantoinase
VLLKAFISSRIVLDKELFDGVVIVENETIIQILKELPKDFDGVVHDLGSDVLAPGIVDTHVHINEPGRTEWEGFLTATSAAAAGGITTVMDMPLNCLPVTTTKDALEIKINEVSGKLFINVGFWGGVVPESLDELEDLLNAGVFGVKSFLIDSGIKEFPEMKEKDLNKAMPIIAKYNCPYLIHAEIDDPSLSIDGATKNYQTFLDSRPRSFENNAIDLMISLSEKNQCPVHIVHLSSSDALPALDKAKKENVLISVETCPHYLLFESEQIQEGETLYKCCPPIREKENKEKLWEGLKNGTIDFIVSDHSPCTPQLKCMSEGDIARAWGGISSLQFGISLIWTEMRQRGMTLNDLFHFMSKKTSNFIGLDQSHGRIKAGYRADFVVFNPDVQYVISKSDILHKNKETPYEGRSVFGKVKQTILSGKVIFKDGQLIGAPHGKPLFKET